MCVPRLILFPGMGANARLFEPQMSLGAQIDVPDWLPATPPESLASYAKRIAQTLDTSTPFVLGGVSFGGMLAWEVAQHLPVDRLRGVLLISTCRSRRGIPVLYRWAGLGAAAMPPAVFQLAKKSAPLARMAMGIVTRQQAAVFDEMLRDADPAFLRWCLWALLRWDGPERIVDGPVLQIHGGSDRILPPRLCGARHVIRGAGHLVNLTHPAEVNSLIRRWLKGLPR